MDERTLPDFGDIQETLRRFNEEHRLVDDRIEADDSSETSLRWEDGEIVRVRKGDDGSA